MTKFHEIDVEGTLKSTERNSIYLKIAADSSLKLRFFPPVGDGKLFTLNVNHFGLEDDGRSVAFGCLNAHGEGGCPLCDIHAALYASDDKHWNKVGDKIKPSTNWYAQVLQGRDVEVKDDNGDLVLGEDKRPLMTTEWVGPYLMRFSKSGADEINDIIRNQKAAGEPYITDHKKGKPVVFTRTGTGFDTDYSAMPMSDPLPLDKAFPEWRNRAFPNIYDKLDVKIRTPEQMIAAATTAHALPWAEVMKEAGLA